MRPSTACGGVHKLGASWCRASVRREQKPKTKARELGTGVRSMLYMDDSLAEHRLFGAAVFMRNAMMVELEKLGFSMSAKGELLPFPLQRS